MIGWDVVASAVGRCHRWFISQVLVVVLFGALLQLF